MSILCYHAVRSDWDSPLAVTPTEFERQMDRLASAAEVVSLDAVAERFDEDFRLPSRVTALTFDDGFSDFYDTVWPILRDRGLPAAVFIVSETLRAGHRVDWIDRFRPTFELTTLTEPQVVELAGEGATIGSHSSFHLTLTELDHDSCVRDLLQSRELLEDVLHQPIEWLAYPRGIHDAGVREAARAAGYRHALTLPERPEPKTAFSIPRTGIYRNDGPLRFEMKQRSWYEAARTSSLYERARVTLTRG